MGAQFIFGLGCMALPLLAWAVLSVEISIPIPFFGIIFNQWRLFILVCGLPSLCCALALLTIPESPKFVLLENREEDAINILRRMFAINQNRSAGEYNVESVYDESLTSKLVVSTSINYKSPINVLRAMWQQTAPLFQKSYIKTTTLACVIQFGIFFTSNGMWMWFPEVLHRIGSFRAEDPSAKVTICEILDSNQHQYSYDGNSNSTDNDCSYKLDDSAFMHVFSLEIGYAVGYAIMGLIINSIGKLSILLIIFIGCGVSGIAIVYSNIPLLSINLYCILLLCGLSIPVVNSATVDLYPTNLRAMAVCISLMMGRLGSMVGANLFGVLIQYSCQYAYAASGISLIGLLYIKTLYEFSNLLIEICFIGCGILVCLIPNIRQSPEKIKNNPV